MAAPTDDPARAPAFPSWPFNCLALYTHMAKDFGRYAQAATEATDPLEATRAEGDLGMSLWSDLMQGYYSLAMAPFTAMASAMVDRSEPSVAPAPAQAQPADAPAAPQPASRSKAAPKSRAAKAAKSPG